jgi:hypothetical protein
MRFAEVSFVKEFVLYDMKRVLMIKRRSQALSKEELEASQAFPLKTKAPANQDR